MMTRWLDRLDRAVAATIAAGRWLVLPISLLLFAQWPLRDVVQSYTTHANDLAQWLFAIYVSLAMTYTTRERTHLAADAFTHGHSPALRDAIRRLAALLFVLPWSLFILIAATPVIWQSVKHLESFPDTRNPGYFIVKASAWLLASLQLVQALLDVLRPRRPA
jgi:TRAP-type mannitol/chloroaromatic compound transport system permease small subunit